MSCNTNKILHVIWKKLRAKSEKIEFLNKILSIAHEFHIKLFKLLTMLEHRRGFDLRDLL
jgi:hypothetical protein